MTDQFAQNMLVALGKELEAQPEKVWVYASFADEEKGFLGAAIVQAHGIVDASLATHRMKINPGGQMMCVPIPEENLPSEKYRNRLLTCEQVQEFWPDARKIKEFDEEN
jgi:hypothetical protein